MYNVDYNKIASDNEIPVNEELVVGQTIVIINNNDIKQRKIKVNGFAFPNVNLDILKNALPHLTYLSIFSYEIDYSGNLKPINDNELIRVAKEYNTIPVMVITNIGIEGRFDSEIAHRILNANDIQEKLIDNVLNIMKEKGYEGLNIDFEYVYPEDRNAYMSFIERIKKILEKYNYFLSVAVAPKTNREQRGLLYEAHDYKRIGELADHVIIMTYEWGYSRGPARAVAPANLVEGVIKYAITEIPSDKILLGIPNYGYDWILPYTEASIAKSVGNYEAVNIARNYNQTINYDYEAESPYFNYYDPATIRHEVWFEDARSIQAKLELVIKYNLEGVSYWTINRIFPQNYLLLDSLFTVAKKIISK